MSQYGAKITPAGQDATKASIQNQQFTSEAISPKILQTSLNKAPRNSGSIATTSSVTVNVQHGLGYSPSFLFWYKDESGAWHFADSMNFNLNNIPAAISTTSVKSDPTNLSVTFANSSVTTAYAVDYHYVIFADQLL